MLQQSNSKNWDDDNGNPSGGTYTTIGLTVVFQEGPLGNGQPNGCWVEDLLQASIQRLEYYQSGKFAHSSNQESINLIKKALMVIEERTIARQQAGVKGFNKDPLVGEK